MPDNCEKLYSIRKDVRCVKCNCKGAVLSVGNFYEDGLGDEIDKFGSIAKSIMEPYRNSPYMDHTMGFGGTIPYECLNCGNTGLIDMGGLEGYEMAFKTIKE